MKVDCHKLKTAYNHQKFLTRLWLEQDLETDFRPLDSRTTMKEMSSLQPLRLWKPVIKAFENCH